MERTYTAQEVNEALESLTDRTSRKVLKILEWVLGKDSSEFESAKTIIFDLMNNEKRFAQTKLQKNNLPETCKLDKQ